MQKVVLLHLVVLVVVSAIGYRFAGYPGLLSALFGGLAYLLPNGLFVLRLKLAVARGRASGAGFFFGEFGKISATVGILLLVQYLYADLQWLYLLIGLFAVLQANLLAFLIKT